MGTVTSRCGVGSCRGRRLAGVALIAAVALGGAVSACGETGEVSSGPATSAVIGPGQGGAGGGAALDAQNQEVIAGLSAEQRACIEGAADAATAVEECVDGSTLAKQVAKILSRSPTFTGITDRDRAYVEGCFAVALEAMPPGQLADLAAQDPAAMASFQDALRDCTPPGAPTTSRPTNPPFATTTARSTGATAPGATSPKPGGSGSSTSTAGTSVTGAPASTGG